MKMEADLLRTLSEPCTKSGLDPGGQTFGKLLLPEQNGKYFIMELKKRTDPLSSGQEDPPGEPRLLLTHSELPPLLEKASQNRVGDQDPLTEGPIEYLCRLDESHIGTHQIYHDLGHGDDRLAALPNLIEEDEPWESNFDFDGLDPFAAETCSSLITDGELLVNLSDSPDPTDGDSKPTAVNRHLVDLESLQGAIDLFHVGPQEDLSESHPSALAHSLACDNTHVGCTQSPSVCAEEVCYPPLSNEELFPPDSDDIPSCVVNLPPKQNRNLEPIDDLLQSDTVQVDPQSFGNETARLRAVFDALDQDGDGFVSIEEFLQFATAYGAEQVKDLTRYLDPAGLGVIGFEDFYRGISEIRNGDPDHQLYDMGYCAEDDHPGCPDEFDDFATFEANEVTDSAYVGSESTYSECETFTDEDTGALAHHEMGDEVELDSAIEVHLNGSLLLTTGRPHLDDLSLGTDINPDSMVAVVGGEEEHFEDYGEGNEPDVFSSSLCNGESIFTDSLDGSMLLSPSPDKRLSSKKVARRLHQTATLNNTEEPVHNHMDFDDTDMNDKVVFLEKRITELEKDAATNEEQHRRLKQENLQLVHRANALEEQLKEQELKAEEDLSEEIRRHKEILSKTEREKDMDYEQLACRVKAIEHENRELRSTIPCIIAHAERLEEIKRRMMDKAEDSAGEVKEAHSCKKKAEDKLSCERHKHQKESESSQKVIEDLRKQLEQLQLYKLEVEQKHGRANGVGLQEYNSRTRESELEQEIRRLKQDNRNLKEQNDELNGQIINLSIQGAKHLFSTSFSDSLAAEISSVSRDELMEAIHKQEEINLRLQDYIDRIIVAIMETNPSILEVKLE
ncbi:rab11 family-interacting protein 3 isoform X2 [Ambystoma mexicanum]|uniref:rab11 family-interacting protein 3 isoform X2 n=1 Tax=Ambystoma mexicanum TaxID=8296 RepID=UPI0037E87064